MRNLNLDQLQTLVAIADLGTLAAASRALHLAPPTVSLHVSELEGRLGYTLVERGARQAALTPAGAVLVDAARRLLRDADQAVERARRVALGREGKVRLGTATGVFVHLLPAVLHSLSERYPGVGIEVEVVSSMDAMRRIAEGALDVGIVALPQAANPQVVVTPWRSDPMVAFVPSAWKPPLKVTPEWLASR
ncbi:MAG TPA: LysR family transcriptional regulator, partial [Rubrivivax sp.]|nr:LysR family transcriptional regulator [Rubrivivax sp.]